MAYKQQKYVSCSSGSCKSEIMLQTWSEKGFLQVTGFALYLHMVEEALWSLL